VVVAAGSVLVDGNSFTSLGATRPRNLPENGEGEEHLLRRMLRSGACVVVYNVGRTPLITDANPSPGLLDAHLHLEYASEALWGDDDPPKTSRPPLPDGRVLFHGNQVTLRAERPPPEFPLPNIPSFRAGAVALFSSDDVSLQDNQVLTEIARGKVFANVVALAPTVRASGNRFTELPTHARLSYLSMGRMGSTTDNQGTHPFLTLATERVHANNQSLIAGRVLDRSVNEGDEL
jgi:hypothetical protein